MDKKHFKYHKVITFLNWIFCTSAMVFYAHFLTSIRGNVIWQRLIYVSIFLFSILLTIGKISKYLDHHYSFVNNYSKRIFKQFLYGFLMPLGSIFIIATLYDVVIDEDAVQRSYLIKEFCFVTLFLYVANGFYIGIKVDQQMFAPVVEEVFYNDKLLVYHKGLYEPVKLTEIAVVYQKNQINWLVTFQEEEHIVDVSLKDVNAILNSKRFFKVNRSHIVNREAVKSLSSGSFGKIMLMLNICGISTTVSKDRAKEFRKWFYD